MSVQRYKDYIERWENPPFYGIDYADQVRGEAEYIRSDGCSGVLDIHVDVCYEHDIHYATHRCFYLGDELTQEDADRYLKWGIQYHSCLGRQSPMALWRYWALSKKKGLGLGRQSWETGPERLKRRLAEPHRKFDEEHIEARKMMGA
ncbi:hypothetical protein LCGC14_0394220 [marine sediment metagenome]|uniref:Uncharacterized protein n=1 Tax=marine sediment metagenome TaxID=412755 RepID=A0A0F9TGQ1_9ZZZZ